MRKPEVVVAQALSLALSALVSATPSHAAPRGVQIPGADAAARSPSPQARPLYAQSKALVIGIDDYRNGWPKLSKAVSDARLVEEVLKDHGFDVRFLESPDAAELESALKRFYVVDGAKPDTRLFLWFAGHGHSEDGLGFIIPADAFESGAQGTGRRPGRPVTFDSNAGASPAAFSRLLKSVQRG